MTPKILLVQLADIGDLILTTPALAALRVAQREAHLTLLTTEHAASVVERGLVDEVITLKQPPSARAWAFLSPRNLKALFDLRSSYDTVIFFHHFTLRAGTAKYALIARLSGATRIIGLDNGNGWFLTERIPDEGFGAQHQAQYWLNLVACLGANPAPQRARVAFDDGVLPLAASRGVRVVIHAGSGGYNTARRWEAEKFAQVADALHAQHEAQIVLVGTADDGASAVKAAMQAPCVDLTGQTTLTQLADILRSADVFIGAESGIMHLAASVRTPTVALFGPSNVDAWGPWSPNGRVAIIRTRPECSPCAYVGHGVGLKQGCAERTCMRMITPERVLQAANALLQNSDYPEPPQHTPEPESLQWPDWIRILGLPIARITFAQWMALINEWVWRGTRPHHVCTVNPEFMMIAQSDANFRHILQRADLCLPDGVGLLWAARWLRNPLLERVTGSDGIWWIAEHAAKNNWKLFLLGAGEGVAERAAGILTEKYFGLMVVGTYSGSPSVEQEDEIVARVNTSGAQVLLVAYGAPAQDKWIARNLPRLNVKMAMGIGGALDFVAGVIPRAPVWMRDYGLEWLFRLYKQPRRIIRMMRLPRFVWAVVLRGEN